ncbi:MAG: ATP-binding protein [Litorimonas sp.]
MPSLIIIAITLTWVYRNTIYRGFDDPIESAVTSLIASADIDEKGALRLNRVPLDPRYQRALSGRYWLIGYDDGTGYIEILTSSRSFTEETVKLSQSAIAQLSTKAGEPIRTVVPGPDENESLRVVARQVILPDMSKPVIILAGADRRAAMNSIRRFGFIASSLLLILTGGLIVAVYTQVRVGLKPLFALRDKVADVREGRNARVDGDYPPEIAPLAKELNNLISHNKVIVERARTHVGNLAHALKTPIAVLQNEAQMGRKTSSDIVTRQTSEMAAQVDHHLRRARAVARGQEIGVITDIDEILGGMVRTMPRIYRDKKFKIIHKGDKGLRFRGAKRDFEEMTGNLMDNAAKWTRNKVFVTTKLAEDDAQMVIIVEDNGPGLAPESYAEALKRGARLDEATPGSGLGLAIVHELAEAYKGSLVLGQSELGGLRVNLTLPRAKD